MSGRFLVSAALLPESPNSAGVDAIRTEKCCQIGPYVQSNPFPGLLITSASVREHLTLKRLSRMKLIMAASVISICIEASLAQVDSTSGSSAPNGQPVDVLLPEGQGRLSCRVLGIAYYFPTSGKYILIAEPKATQGILQEFMGQVNRAHAEAVGQDLTARGCGFAPGHFLAKRGGNAERRGGGLGGFGREFAAEAAEIAGPGGVSVGSLCRTDPKKCA